MIHRNMSWDDYDNLDAVSHSDLKAFAEGKKGGSKSRRMHLGTLIHTLLLEGGEKARADFVFEKELPDRRTKIGKEAWENMVRDVGHDRILTVDEAKKAKRCCDSLMAHPQARKAVESAEQKSREIVVCNSIDGHDINNKGRIDILHKGCVIDIKTTGFANQEKFVNQIVEYGYASQGAYYVDLCQKELGGEYLPFIFLCVSVREPFQSWIYRLNNEQMAFGRKWYTNVLSLIRRYGVYWATEVDNKQESTS